MKEIQEQSIVIIALKDYKLKHLNIFSYPQSKNEAHVLFKELFINPDLEVYQMTLDRFESILDLEKLRS